MSFDCSVSLQGILNAERNFEQAARRIASGVVPIQEANAGDGKNKSFSLDDFPDSLSLSDFAAELLALHQAKIAFKSNLQAIFIQQELNHEVLDLFG